MGSNIPEEELEEIERSLVNSCEKLRLYINNLCMYIYKKDEKKHMQ